jgi:hypothetical protein
MFLFLFPTQQFYKAIKIVSKSNMVYSTICLISTSVFKDNILEPDGNSELSWNIKFLRNSIGLLGMAFGPPQDSRLRRQAGIPTHCVIISAGPYYCV